MTPSPQSNELIISSLGSGSDGNSFLVEIGEQRVLIDAGVPIRTLIACLRKRGTTPADIIAAFISHEHTDHVRALPSLLGKKTFPVFATRGTHAGLPNVPNRERQTLKPLDPVVLGSLTVTPIPVSHDAREPVGYYLECEDVSVAIFTDLGEISDVNAEFAARASHLIIESNYDEHMLRSGPYPAYLKQRIRSAGGHLSNDDCAAFLQSVVSQRTGSIWLCHLSENNNRPEVAVSVSSDLLRSRGQIRDVIPLPRYDGTILTWRSSDSPRVIDQSAFEF